MFKTFFAYRHFWVLFALVGASFCQEYVPGTPGAPWTVEEQMAVRGKLYFFFRRRQAPEVLRLAFHDCLKYTDGTGGCDGCINWAGVGHAFPR